MKVLVVMFKALWIAARHRPKQDFVNDLYMHEQRRHYKRHAGIDMKIPPSKYFPDNHR